MSMDVVIHRIQNRLKDKKLSAQQASIDAGLSKDGLRNVFRQKSATYSTLEKIAKTLDMPLSELVADEESELTRPQPEPGAIAPMPESLKSDKPVELDQKAFAEAMRGVNYWKEKRGGHASVLEISKLLWMFYEHALRNGPLDLEFNGETAGNDGK